MIKWSRIFRVFVAEYLGLKPEAKLVSSDTKRREDLVRTCFNLPVALIVSHPAAPVGLVQTARCVQTARKYLNIRRLRMTARLVYVVAIQFYCYERRYCQAREGLPAVKSYMVHSKLFFDATCRLAVLLGPFESVILWRRRVSHPITCRCLPTRDRR